ncbi:TRAP transporter large permease subunit, partial [Actinobacillus seminis]
TFEKFKRSILNAAAMTAMCTLIISVATILSWIIAFTRLPDLIIGFLTSITDNPYIILLLLVAFLLFIGMFIETIAATIIVAPILMPVAYQYGIDPIQFAIIMIVVLVYAEVTPPVGGVLFITMGIANVKLQETLKYLVPYLGIIFIVILLMILFPSISLMIPNIFR